jgi:hypothetical protein
MISKFRSKHLTFKEIAALAKVSTTAAYENAHLDEDATAKRKQQDTVRRALARAREAHPRKRVVGARTVLKFMPKSSQLSESTVKRRLAEIGVRARKRPRKPKLKNEEHDGAAVARQARLQGW